MSSYREQSVTIEELASSARWELERIKALEGRCVGSLMKDWAVNLRQRFGEHAEAHVRNCLGDWSEALPAAPVPSVWLPVALKLRTFDVIRDEFLGGDLLRLEAMLWEDLERDTSPTARGMLRLTGPNVLLRQAGTFHAKLYDQGTLLAQVGWGEATLDFSKALFFGNPTWRILQAFALRFLLKLTGREERELVALPAKEDAFRIRIRWK